MNYMLFLRRLRLSFIKRLKSTDACTICGGETERFEFVCGDEACQTEALCGQAMLANTLAEPPATPHRVMFASEKPGKAFAGVGSWV